MAHVASAKKYLHQTRNQACVFLSCHHSGKAATAGSNYHEVSYMEDTEEANTFRGRPGWPSPPILIDRFSFVSKFRMLEEKVVVLEETQSRLLQELVVLESRNSGVGQAIHSAQERSACSRCFPFKLRAFPLYTLSQLCRSGQVSLAEDHSAVGSQ